MCAALFISGLARFARHVLQVFYLGKLAAAFICEVSATACRHV